MGAVVILIRDINVALFCLFFVVIGGLLIITLIVMR